jgi:hypothetical protein
VEGRNGQLLSNKVWLIAVIVMFSACMPSNAAAQPAIAVPGGELPAQFAATAIGQAGEIAGKSFGVTIYVTGLTSDEEVQEFAATLKGKGQSGLVSALENAKDVGRVSPTGSVGNGFRIARVHPGKGGGTNVVMVTNRPISFGELYRGTRSTDYPFGIVTLNLDKDGKGTGTLAPMCKVRFNKKGELEIEHYGQKPFRLANVRREK